MHDFHIYLQLRCWIRRLEYVAPMDEPGRSGLNGNTSTPVGIFRVLRAGPACH